MTELPTAVGVFCHDPNRDPVASGVFERFLAEYGPSKTDVEVDGLPVLAHEGPGQQTLLVRTDDVVSHDYPRYLPLLTQQFGDAEALICVNWHEGENAPDRVLTVHSTGDVPSGHWSPVDPRHIRNLCTSLETLRQHHGLGDFAVVIEATHWSGIPYGGEPELISQYAVPVYDLEIGSSRPSWENDAAARVLAEALLHVLDPHTEERRMNALCGGGVHLEAAYSQGVLQSARLAVGHLLPNQWLVTGGYGEADRDEADQKLDRCASSILGGVDVVDVHDKLKAEYKDAFRRLADRLGAPIVKHKALSRIDEIVLQ